MDRADLYEKNEAVAQQRRDVVNYYFSGESCEFP
ncbi:Protein CBG10006 [Caenorhabditis briggsae]|uniref:Protein CBG10006 n=1 Tax=Caenorhabditis briggsae TaxID=6238 RepID=A8XA57_CAEBR|nr:Protein CBG10006 [Caenorhabditis briggsae]CAP29525.2 Protein CBG10006 [Caenorhabditis briggsae]